MYLINLLTYKQSGEYLDSSIFLGADSSYSVSVDDNVFLESWREDDLLDSDKQTKDALVVSEPVADGLTKYVIELQVNRFTYM